MKFVRASEEGKQGRVFTFEVSKREKLWLLATLRHYPLIDPEYYKLSRGEGAVGTAEQKLLEESMAELRVSHGRKLEQLLQNSARFQQVAAGVYHLQVTVEEADWLLQVLNDVRVGSWIRLGRPDPEESQSLKIAPDTMRFLTAMQLSGYFQMAILQAFQS